MRHILLSVILSACAFAQTTISGGANLSGGATLGGVLASETRTATKITLTGTGTTNGNILAGFGAPYTATLGSTIAAGHIALLVCANQTHNAGTAYNWTTSDSNSNTWTYASTVNTTLQNLEVASRAIGIAYTKVTNPMSGTVTFNPSVDGHQDCSLFDVSGASTGVLDQIAGNATVWGATATSGSITPSASSSLAFGVLNVSNATTASYGNIMGSAATGLVNVIDGAMGTFTVEWMGLSSNTAGTATFGLSPSDNGAALFFNFK